MTSTSLQIDLVPCLVTPEWAAAVSSVISGFHGCFDDLAQLWREMALLDQIIYKNSAQHRCSRPHARLVRVLGLLRVARVAAVDDAVAALRDAAALASRPTATLHERAVPRRCSARATRRRLLGVARAAAATAAATIDAAAQLTTQLARTFFMPFSLTCLAVMARIRVLSCHYLLECVRCYNAAAELEALLPPLGGEASPPPLDALPRMLQCVWKDAVPELRAVCDFDDGDGMNNKGLMGLRVLQQSAGAAVSMPALERGEEDLGVAICRDEVGVDVARVAQQGVPSLAVVEDRGEDGEGGASAAATAAAAAAALPQAASYARDAADTLGRASAPHSDAKNKGKKKKIMLQHGAPASELVATAVLAAKTTTTTTDATASAPVVRPQVGALAAGGSGTAFISIDAVGPPSSRAQRKRAAEGAAAGAPNVGKSWEEWLAPPVQRSTPHEDVKKKKKKRR